MITKKVLTISLFLILSSGGVNSFGEDVPVQEQTVDMPPADPRDEGVSAILEVNGSGTVQGRESTLLGSEMQQKHNKQIKLVKLSDETAQLLQSSETYYYSSTEPGDQVLLEPHFDNSPYYPKLDNAINSMPVLDQGNTGTCSTFSSTEALDILCGDGQDTYSVYDNLTLGYSLSHSAEYPFLLSGYNYDEDVSPIVKGIGDNNYPDPWAGTWPLEMLSQFYCYGLYPQPAQHDQDGDFGEKKIGESHKCAITQEELSNFQTPPFNYKSMYYIYNTKLNAEGLDKTKLVDKIKNELDNGHLVVISISLYNFGNCGMSAQFYPQLRNDNNMYTCKYNYTTNTGGKQFPDLAYNVWFYQKGMEKQKILGGHSLLITGYFNSKEGSNIGVFVVRNSWGESNGDSGDNYIDYNYITNLTTAAVSVYSQSADQN